MPKATIKSKNSSADKPKLSLDAALDSFIETGHFELNNEILTAEWLIYFIEYLDKLPKTCFEQNCKLYLSQVTFNAEFPTIYSQEERLEATVGLFLNQLFHYSTKWHVVALDNVTILQGEDRYLLSPHFIDRLLLQLSVMTDSLTELSITNAEFHSFAWIRFLTIPPKLDILTLELLNEDKSKTDNLIVLCEALQYAKIKTLNLANTELSAEGYQALHALLDKNYFIEKMQLKAPRDPESEAIFKKINERLPEGRTGKQRFDLEKFNQAEFLRLILEAQNVLQHETDEIKIRTLKIEIKFLLEKKVPFSVSITNRENCLSLLSETHAVYFDHAEYIEGRLALFRLDLNLIVNNGSRTLGHCLLENALKRDDRFMVSCLIDAGANLFEQQGDEKPFLIQIFEKNTAFKVLILDHIFYDQHLVRTAKRVLQPYSKSKEIMVSMGFSLIRYAETLKKRTYPYLLSDFERLLNLLKDFARLPRPSKKREKEFIEIYFSLFKCLILLDNDFGRVTEASVSKVQIILAKIMNDSLSAARGLNNGSMLHNNLVDWTYALRKEMDENKKLIAKDNALYEKDKVIEQQADTIKNISEECAHLKATVQQVQENAEAERRQFKAELAAMHAQLEAATKDSETSNAPGPSGIFFSKR